MGVRKRGAGDAWEITIEMGKSPEGKRIQETFTVHCETEEEARIEEYRLKFEHKTGQLVNPGAMTVGEFLDLWLKIGTANLKYSTEKSYHNQIDNHIKPYFKDVRLDKLSPISLGQYYAYKKKEGLLSSTTINYHHRIMRSIFGDAVKWKKLRSNPCEGVSPPRKNKFRATILTPDQLNKVLDYLRDSPIYISILLSLLTGMRRGETCGLHWSDIDFNKKVIFIKYSMHREKGKGVEEGDTKSGKDKIVPMSKLLIKELQAHQELQAKWKEVAKESYKDEDLVVCWQDGRRMDPDMVTKKYNKALDKLELPRETRTHDLRHFHANALLDLGADIKDVSEELGHSSVSITGDMYLASGVERRRKFVNKLDKKLKK